MKSDVEVADRLSRRRALGFALAALAFLLVQLIARPVLLGQPDTAAHSRPWVWLLNAVFLMLCLATGGGQVYSRRVRSLMNDEISRNNRNRATAVGYWTATLLALALFTVNFKNVTARDGAWLIVTVSLGVALLVFSWLEFRAHADD